MYTEKVSIFVWGFTSLMACAVFMRTSRSNRTRHHGFIPAKLGISPEPVIVPETECVSARPSIAKPAELPPIGLFDIVRHVPLHAATKFV
jgi:hypothetical protein